MASNTSGPQRLYLMQVATAPGSNTPFPCYYIRTGDGHNILIDTGFPADFQPPTNRPGPPLQMGSNVMEQLKQIGVQPGDIDMLICTHFDGDHAGNLAAFPNAQLIAQRLLYETARSGYQRFAPMRSQWDQPASRYRLIDGDTELLPGLDLIETSGHVPGHQSVLVRLPHTGTVLLTIDAVTVESNFTPDREGSPMDADAAGAIASTQKLLDLARREHVSLIIFGHDGQQWSSLKKLPEYYD
ncbi:MAG TPA: N-acyl homoserine lactonase family protein [Ktedonobacteraceae bacterium]|jgi:N-acyl homoserine lactone hydrolase|nr:N-acyl homoserine lactonase family protein [Ktedonobacteraceae bacterium]